MKRHIVYDLRRRFFVAGSSPGANSFRVLTIKASEVCQQTFSLASGWGRVRVDVKPRSG